MASVHSANKPKPKRPNVFAVEPRPPINWNWVLIPAVWILLTLAGFYAYSNSFDGKLFFDDLSSVIGNPHLQVFSNPHTRWTWEGWVNAFGAQIDTPFAGRPIVSFTFALNHWWAFSSYPAEIPEFYGVLPPHHWYYHFVNFAFHIAVAILLWHFLRRTLRSPNVAHYTGAHADLWATAISVLWVMHPLNTETVVYITQRTEQVLSFFLLMTMYFSSRSIDSRIAWSRWTWQIGAILACALGMASKENMVAVPLLVVIYDRTFYYSSWRETFQRRGAFYIPIFLTLGVLFYINAIVPEVEKTFKLGFLSETERLRNIAREFLSFGSRLIILIGTMALADRLMAFDSWRETLAARGKVYITLFFAVGLFLAATDLVGNKLFPPPPPADPSSMMMMHPEPKPPIFYAFHLARLAGLYAILLAVDGLLFYRDLAKAVMGRWKFNLAMLACFLVSVLHREAGPRGMSVGFEFQRMDWLEYLITQNWCLLRYLRLCLFPTGLCVDYGRLAILDLPDVLPGAVVVLSLLAMTVWGMFKKPWVGFLGAWFFFILAPTSSFIPIVTEVGAERRMYLPMVAVLVGIGAAIQWLYQKIAPARNGYESAGPAFGLGLSCLVIGYIAWFFFSVAPKDDKTPLDLYVQIGTFLAILAFIGSATLFLIGMRRSDEESAGLIHSGAYASLLASVAIILGLISYERNKDYLAESPLYGHIAKVFPWNERGRNNYAKICIDENRIEEAEENLNAALHIDPEYSDAFTNRGIVFHRRKQMDRAIQNATEALRWNPMNPSAWNNRGNAFIELKLFHKAVADFTKLVEMNPRGVEGFYGRANTYYLSGEPRKALGDIDAVIERSPGDYKAFNTRGNILKNLNEPERAIESFSRGVELVIKEGTSAGNPIVPALLMGMQGKINEKVTILNMEVTVHQAIQNFYNRGTLATLMGNRADAYRMLIDKYPEKAKQNMFDDLTRAIILQTENPMYWLARAQQRYLNKEYPAAANDFTEALNRQPNLIDALRGRVLSNVGAKNWDAVKQDVEAMRKLGAPVDDPTLEQFRKDSGRDDIR